MTIKGKDGTSTRSKELNSEYPDLNEFELLDTLGTGTFGRVRLCRHTKQDKYFALKILKKNEIIRLKQVEHIISEKHILGKVDHPFIVKLYVAYTGEGYLPLNNADTTARSVCAACVYARYRGLHGRRHSI